MRSSTNLDVLRASAVLAVYVAHLSHCLSGENFAGYGFFEAIGRFGVILFFLHTSLVLMMSMDRTASEPAFVARFYVRRAFRIYPLSILAVVTIFILHLPPNAWSRPHSYSISAFQLISNLLLIQNITQVPSILGVLWSLPLEVQMYAVLPFLFFMVRSRNWRRRLLICLGIAVVSAGIVWSFTGKLNIFAFIPCFLAGVMAYKRLGRKPTMPAWTWVVLILGLLVSIAALPFYQRNFLQPVTLPMEWAVVWTLGFTWPMFREVTWKPLVRAGELIARYSYGIYLAHTYALYICFVQYKSSPAISVSLATIITTALAVSAYHFVEKPFITVGKRAAVLIGGKAVPALVETEGAGSS